MRGNEAITAGGLNKSTVPISSNARWAVIRVAVIGHGSALVEAVGASALSHQTSATEMSNAFQPMSAVPNVLISDRGQRVQDPSAPSGRAGGLAEDDLESEPAFSRPPSTGRVQLASARRIRLAISA